MIVAVCCTFALRHEMGQILPFTPARLFVHSVLNSVCLCPDFRPEIHLVAVYAFPLPASLIPRSFLIEHLSHISLPCQHCGRPRLPRLSTTDREREGGSDSPPPHHRRGSYDLTRLRCEGGGRAGLTLFGVRSPVLTKIDKEIGRFFCGADAESSTWG